jgi:hypothetical protein
MKQIMEWMLARMDFFHEEMKTNQPKMDANKTKVKTNQEMLAKMKTNRAEILATMEVKMGINLKEVKEEIRTDLEEMEEAVRINQEKTDPTLKEVIVEIRVWRKEMTACQEAMEACLESKEPTLVEVESVAMHEEVPKEEAALKTVGALKKRYGDRHLAIGFLLQLQKRTRGNGGSRKKLAAIRRQMPAVQERHRVRDAVIKDRQSNRGGGEIGPGTVLQEP